MYPRLIKVMASVSLSHNVLTELPHYVTLTPPQMNPNHDTPLWLKG